MQFTFLLLQDEKDKSPSQKTALSQKWAEVLNFLVSTCVQCLTRFYSLLVSRQSFQLCALKVEVLSSAAFASLNGLLGVACCSRGTCSS